MLNALVRQCIDKAAAHGPKPGRSSPSVAGERPAGAGHAATSSRQIQIATDGVKGGAARLAQVDIPSYPDTETTFPELKERIGKTIAFLEGVEAARFEGAEDRTVALKLGSNDVTFPAKHYLFSFVIPNFYFHATTAYDILRHNGLEIGKRDFLGEL